MGGCHQQEMRSLVLHLARVGGPEGLDVPVLRGHGADGYQQIETPFDQALALIAIGTLLGDAGGQHFKRVVAEIIVAVEVLAAQVAHGFVREMLRLNKSLPKLLQIGAVEGVAATSLSSGGRVLSDKSKKGIEGSNLDFKQKGWNRPTWIAGSVELSKLKRWRYHFFRMDPSHSKTASWALSTSAVLPTGL